MVDIAIKRDASSVAEVVLDGVNIGKVTLDSEKPNHYYVSEQLMDWLADHETVYESDGPFTLEDLVETIKEAHESSLQSLPKKGRLSLISYITLGATLGDGWDYWWKVQLTDDNWFIAAIKKDNGVYRWSVGGGTLTGVSATEEQAFGQIAEQSAFLANNMHKYSPST